MLRRIRIDQLRPGMYVERLDRNWLSVPIFRPRITAAEQVAELNRYDVREVVIDTDRGDDLPPGEPDAGASPAAPPRPALPAGGVPPAPVDPVPYFEEIANADRVHDRALQSVSDLMEAVRRNERLPLVPVQDAVREIIASVVRNRDALHSLLHLRRHSESVFRHCVSVGVLSIAMGYSMGLTGEELQTLGMGAIIHDLGKMKLPREVMEKTEALTEEEYLEYQAHPLEGARLLDEVAAFDKQSMMVVLHHHERNDGSGFPQGLPDEQIHDLAKVVALVDTYEILISGTQGREQLTPHGAMDWIRKWGHKEFAADLVDRFEQGFGLYPVGTFVRLSDNRLGVVIAVHHNAGRLPLVSVVFDADHREQPPGELVDVGDQDPADPITIVAAVMPESFGFDLAGYIRTHGLFKGKERQPAVG